MRVDAEQGSHIIRFLPAKVINPPTLWGIRKKNYSWVIMLKTKANDTFKQSF